MLHKKSLIFLISTPFLSLLDIFAIVTSVPTVKKKKV